MTPLITLTAAALEHVKRMMEKQGHGIGFRLSIKKMGCTGYSYVPDIIDEVQPNDIHFEQDGLALFVDPDCEKFVNGLIIDYTQEARAGLKQKVLVYINPNEKNRCGCGESFTTE